MRVSAWRVVTAAQYVVLCCCWRLEVGFETAHLFLSPVVQSSTPCPFRSHRSSECCVSRVGGWGVGWRVDPVFEIGLPNAIRRRVFHRAHGRENHQYFHSFSYNLHPWGIEGTPSWSLGIVKAPTPSLVLPVKVSQGNMETTYSCKV